jgi:transposase
MKLFHERCAGLDVHKETVVACIRVHEKGRVTHDVRTFGTTTNALLELSDWLAAHRVTHAVMESTGVYWKPVWHVLSDGSIELTLANAEHVRNVPGRKTDVKDAVWLADLLAHGLIRSSFVPPAAIEELRDLTRTRRQLVRQRVQHVQRIQKTLESANVKLESVISDVLGASGRAMVEAIIEGETNAERLADFAHPRLKATREKLLAALHGKVTAHHRFMLKMHLEQVDATDKTISTLDQEVERALEPFQVHVDLLKTMPGISEQVARTLIAEIGIDMKAFPTAGHLVSWAGLCPQLNESAGKRRNTRVRKGAPWLKPVLVQVAWAAARKKDSYLKAQFLRLRARRGPKKAVVAVAASMLTAAYYMLRDGTAYQDLGALHFDAADKARATKSLVRRLERLGYRVDLKEQAA